MADYSDLLAMMGEFMRDSDRKHAEHKERMDAQDRVVQHLLEAMSGQFERMDQRFEKMDQRFERIEVELTQLNGRMGNIEHHLSEIDATTKHSLLESKVIVLKINSLDEAVGRIEKFQQTQEDVLRRLGILEGAVLAPVMRRT